MQLVQFFLLGDTDYAVIVVEGKRIRLTDEAMRGEGHAFVFPEPCTEVGSAHLRRDPCTRPRSEIIRLEYHRHARRQPDQKRRQELE